jgi:hypothetical protein
MPVELRCPDCRAKLRLPDAPDPGTEVECPKCGHVFPAPDLDTGEVPDARAKKRPADDEDDDRPRKKKRPADDDDEDRPRKPADDYKPKEKKKAAGGKTPQRRRAKKKETNKGLLTVMIVGGVLFLILLIGLLVWYFGRKPPAYEMMGYLPADAQYAVGVNIGHMQKYPEFYKKVEPSYKDVGFKKFAEVMAKAIGIEPDDLIDYLVAGGGSSGDAVVIKTKTPFDPAGLAKLPGAQEYAADGQKYYTVADIPGVFGGIQVFAPTNRLIVYCSRRIPETTFKNMLKGNKDNFDATLPGRSGPLGKRLVKGTLWAMFLFEGGYARPAAPNPGELGQGNLNGAEFKNQVASQTGGAKGSGFKASLGSKSVRFEAVSWYGDSEAAANQYQKFKESPLAKGDEEEPPRWWKDMLQAMGISKKMGQELLSSVGAKTSGELYVMYTECDTKTLMDSIGGLIGKFIGPKPPG